MNTASDFSLFTNRINQEQGLTYCIPFKGLR